MLRIVGGELETPQVRLVSLFAVRLVLLGDESGLVGRHLHQVLGTGCHGACDNAETVTDGRFTSRHKYVLSICFNKSAYK